MRPVPVEVGQPFGRLAVIDPDAGRRDGRRQVRVICDPKLGGCGNELVVLLENARRGNTRSCGCLQRDITAAGNAARVIHGYAGQQLYKTWRHMLSRCENEADPQYGRYGGRGITVWGPWHDMARFAADVEAEIGPRPPGTHPSGHAYWTLDRRDNDAGYRPGNIRWSDAITQRHNQEGQ